MRSKLTVKQQKFCELYAQSGNASEAYRGAYNCAKMKPESIHSKSYELMQNGEVAVRVAELQKATSSARIATAAERQEFLTTMLRDGEADPKDRLKATEVLGRMQGDFIDKLHLTGEVNAVVYRDFTTGGVSK